MLLFSRQGKLRLQKWYVSHPDKTKKKITRDLINTILSRKPKMSSFLEWKDLKIVYKRYTMFSQSILSILQLIDQTPQNRLPSPNFSVMLQVYKFQVIFFLNKTRFQTPNSVSILKKLRNLENNLLILFFQHAATLNLALNC